MKFPEPPCRPKPPTPPPPVRPPSPGCSTGPDTKVLQDLLRKLGKRPG